VSVSSGGGGENPDSVHSSSTERPIHWSAVTLNKLATPSFIAWMTPVADKIK